VRDGTLGELGNAIQFSAIIKVDIVCQERLGSSAFNLLQNTGITIAAKQFCA
jgi:hypothetical protein